MFDTQILFALSLPKMIFLTSQTDESLSIKRKSFWHFFRNENSLCSCCWSNVLTTTRGWRKALLYLPLSCVLAWRPNRLWLSYVAGKRTQIPRSISPCEFLDVYRYGLQPACWRYCPCCILHRAH